MKVHNIGPSVSDSSFFSIAAPPDGPHLSGDLDNVTFSQVLDYVLQTYPGFWAYESCENEDNRRTIFVKFFPSVPPGIAKFQ